MTTKNWKKTTEGSYSFFIDEQEIGTMNIAHSTLERAATCSIAGKDLVIKRTGFWKSTIEITDASGQLNGKIYPEKWYASSWAFDYQNKKYKVIVRNNPLAEFVIQENGKDQIAYALNTSNKVVNVRITTTTEPLDLLFDFVLWYLFVPVATENMDDNFTFLLLATA